MVKKRPVTKKRTLSRRRVTNYDLHERLVRIETLLTPLPAKVEKLEAHRNYLVGAWAVISFAFAAAFKYVKGH